MFSLFVHIKEEIVLKIYFTEETSLPSGRKLSVEMSLIGLHRSLCNLVLEVKEKIKSKIFKYCGQWTTSRKNRRSI